MLPSDFELFDGSEREWAYQPPNSFDDVPQFVSATSKTEALGTRFHIYALNEFGQLIATLDHGSSILRGLEFSRDGSRLYSFWEVPNANTLSGWDPSKIVSFETTSWHQVGEISIPHPNDTCNEDKFDPNRRLLYVCDNRAVRALNISDGIEVQSFKVSDGATSISISGNGELIAAATKGLNSPSTTVVYDVGTAKVVCRNSGKDANVVALNRDGSELAVGGGDKMVSIAKFDSTMNGVVIRKQVGALSCDD